MFVLKTCFAHYVNRTKLVDMDETLLQFTWVFLAAIVCGISSTTLFFKYINANSTFDARL